MITVQQRTFIESFDAVRFGDEAELDPFVARAHAELELLVGLLFGQGVHVSEAMAMDSRGFLAAAFNVVVAYKASLPRLRPSPEPLVIGTVGPAKPLKQILIERLRRPGFYLSGWPNLLHKMEARVKLAALIADDDFRAAIDQCAEWSFSEEMENLDRLCFLSEHFHAGRSFPISAAPVPLDAYPNALSQVMPGFVRDERRLLRASRMVDAIQHLANRGVSLDNRSGVRLHRDELTEKFGVATYDDLIDFADTAYNMVVADSMGTDQNLFSVRKAGNPGDMYLGEDIAHAVRRKLVPIADPVEGAGQTRIDISIDSRLYPVRVAESQQIEWTKIMQVLNSDVWLNSMQNLRTALRDGRNEQACACLDRHLELVNAEMDAYSIERRDGILRIFRDVRADPKKALVDGAKTAVELGVSALFQIPWIGKVVAAATGAILDPTLPEPGRKIKLITGQIEQISDASNAANMR